MLAASQRRGGFDLELIWFTVTVSGACGAKQSYNHLHQKDRLGKGCVKLCFLSMWAIVAMW
ncbi:MAG TPA: hypothetical protein DEQ87_00065 [Algoriphagus sp.]|jgi:hypothetical protein|nr:hypothetical protein [Algoriphagus sp.]MAL15674.1 hypothetical protein [Algoriphagus sp.]HAD52758.1 hypothetical protein [Algoriphagus sp.]HAS58244.1 hypothetical protein [Algoriphagus sp.]HCD86029.1 hypothetical protein [Algoriphagus sp.]